jgi:hypothetical protein
MKRPKAPKNNPASLAAAERGWWKLIYEIADEIAGKDVRITNLLKVKFQIDRENLLHPKIYIYERRRQS